MAAGRRSGGNSNGSSRRSVVLMGRFFTLSRSPPMGSSRFRRVASCHAQTSEQGGNSVGAFGLRAESPIRMAENSPGSFCTNQNSGTNQAAATFILTIAKTVPCRSDRRMALDADGSGPVRDRSNDLIDAFPRRDRSDCHQLGRRFGRFARPDFTLPPFRSGQLYRA